MKTAKEYVVYCASCGVEDAQDAFVDDNEDTIVVCRVCGHCLKLASPDRPKVMELLKLHRYANDIGKVTTDPNLKEDLSVLASFQKRVKVSRQRKSYLDN